MPRASKRQKISEGLSRPKSAPAAKGKSKKARAPPQAPLGAEEVQALVADDAAKDDEERRLESILFGTPYVPTGKGKAKEDALDETFEDADINEDAGRELENMLDTDVRPCVALPAHVLSQAAAVFLRR
jgi:U3 small nucleolar RNA-associated protein 18